jgi:hypothetical protein
MAAALLMILSAMPASAQPDVVYEDGRLVVIQDADWCQDLLPGQALRAARQRCVDGLAAMADVASREKRTLFPASFVLAFGDATDTMDVAEPAAPAPAPAAPARSAIADSGTYAVGSQVSPGRYQTAGPEGDTLFCYYARLAGFSGEIDDIIANDNTEGPAIVEISPTDAAFETSGCQPWVPVG